MIGSDTVHKQYDNDYILYQKTCWCNAIVSEISLKPETKKDTTQRIAPWYIVAFIKLFDFRVGFKTRPLGYESDQLMDFLALEFCLDLYQEI